MKIEKVNIKEVLSNPDNPRTIKDEKFKKLVASIKEFPEMLEIRPIVVDENMITLGGNMRLKACKTAGLKEVFIIRANELTEDQKKQFIVKDNSSFGEWDFHALEKDFDFELLSDWGIDVPEVSKIINETLKEPKKDELKPYKKTHILLSFSPEKIMELKPFIDKILELEFVEYEQSSN